jgi:3-oxoacyl-[acyl-carrier protein] reductase
VPEFEGQTVLLTGAAGGIGRACAAYFTERGATVVGGDVNESTETAAACADTPGQFESVRADVTDPAAVTALVERAADTGRIDALVNVAGIIERLPLAEYSDEAWDQIVATNLTAPFRLAREAAPHLRETGGAVVSVSSIYGQVGASERVGYVATKAGVEGLTRALAAELGPDGVRVNAVAPGFVWTPMTDSYREDEVAQERFRAQTALGRLGEPDDVAGVVGFLASEAAGFVTGETVLVDGGRATLE